MFVKFNFMHVKFNFTDAKFNFTDAKFNLANAKFNFIIRCVLFCYATVCKNVGMVIFSYN